MNESIEEAARAEVQAQAISSAEVACLLHAGVTVLHMTRDGCPLCRSLDPESLVKAIHAVSSAPKPFAEVYEAIKAIEPFTAQLGGRAITAYGHTVADVQRLGRAEAGLKSWLNGKPGDVVKAVRTLFATLTDDQRADITGDFCRFCLRPTTRPDGYHDVCHCENDE